jgi:hypothetical protein
MDLRKQARLYLLGDFQFLSRTAFGFKLLGKCAAFDFYTESQLVEAGKAERVTVHVFESREDSTPGRDLRWKKKANSATPPFVELGGDILGEKVNLAVAAYGVIGLGAGCGLGQCNVGVAVWRRDLDPPTAGFNALIYHYPEAKLVDVETQAAILIANKNHDEVQAEIGILLVQAQERSVNTKRYGRIVHPRNYKGGKQQTRGEFCS